LGNKVFDEQGHLDKKIVADLVFKNDIVKSSLEDLLHPLVFEWIESFLKTIDNKEAVVVIEVPLLFERGYDERFDRTITVFTDAETALRRLEKKGVSRNEAIARLQSQLPVDEKMNKSDFRINNNDTVEETMTQVTAIYKKILQEACIGNN
jgi:dephospho-CoA kinase